MEGQPDTEPGAGEQLQQQRDAAEDEWKLWQGGQLRHTLHLISAVAQWVLLLACLVYLGVHFLRPSKSQGDKVLWTHIRYTGRCTRGAAVNLTVEFGSILVRNGSILVPRDGLYLMSLTSGITLLLEEEEEKEEEEEEEEEEELKLSLQKTDQTTSRVLWEEVVQGNDSTVHLSTLLYLFEQDSITLWSSFNAILSDLTLSLVLVAENKG